MSAYEIIIDRDYGHDESFEADTEQEARTIYGENIGEADVRRVTLVGPDLSLHWNAAYGGDPA